MRARAALWPLTPRIVLGEAQKFEAFRTARAALAASGTVTLELALAGVPTVGAYKVSFVEEQLKYLIKVPSILLPNLILGDRSIPEKLQRDCNPAALAAALAAVVRDGPERQAQIEALARLDGLMRLPDGGAPSAHAARAVLGDDRGRAQPAVAAAQSSFKETLGMHSRAQLRCNCRKKAFPFVSFCFHLFPRIGAYQGVTPREGENSFFRVLLLPYSTRCSSAGAGR